MFILKAAIELQTFFFTFILMGMQAWGQDEVNSYKLTQFVDDSFRKLVVTTRNVDNIHVHLAEFEDQAGNQDPELQEGQGAAAQAMEGTNTGTIVTGWFPDPNHSNRYGAVHYPYVSEKSNIEPGGFFQITSKSYRITWSSEAAIPSVDLLKRLSGLSSWEPHATTLLLPLPPMNIPDPSMPGATVQVIPEMSTVAVLRYQDVNPGYCVNGWLRRASSESGGIFSSASFTSNPEDGSVRLDWLIISSSAAIVRIPPTEDHSQLLQNELMERFCNRLEVILAGSIQAPLLAVSTALLDARIGQIVAMATVRFYQESIQAAGLNMVEYLFRLASEGRGESESEMLRAEFLLAQLTASRPGFVATSESILHSLSSEISEQIQEIPETLRETIEPGLRQTLMPESILGIQEIFRSSVSHFVEQGMSETNRRLQMIGQETRRVQSPLPPERETEVSVSTEITDEPELRETLERVQLSPRSRADNSTEGNHSSNGGMEVSAELPDAEDVTNRVILLPDVSAGLKHHPDKNPVRLL